MELIFVSSKKILNSSGQDWITPCFKTSYGIHHGVGNVDCISLMFSDLELNLPTINAEKLRINLPSGQHNALLLFPWCYIVYLLQTPLQNWIFLAYPSRAAFRPLKKDCIRQNFGGYLKALSLFSFFIFCFSITASLCH